MATQEFKVKMCAEDMNRAAVILKWQHVYACLSLK
jgi:hypothetical protein